MNVLLLHRLWFQSSYKHFRDHVTWVWASTKGDDVTDGTLMHTVQFDLEYLRNLPPGGYYLAYFSSQKNGIVGYSDLLQVRIR
jgi:SKICH domain